MIKHSKVRISSVCILLGFSFLSLYTIISPTQSVENKSVNEQVCSQPNALEIEENTVSVTGSGSTMLTPVKISGIYPNTGIPVQSTIEETNGETQTYNYNKTGWLCTNVRLRSEPSVESEILDLYVYNTEIRYADYDDEWVVVEYNDSYGFMAKEYIYDSELPEYIEEVTVNYEYNNTYNGTKLTPGLGTVNGPNGKETYYNLPMSLVIKYMQDLGYNYTYWVRSDGCKMYGDYIMLAADTNVRPKGTILETSLGLGMVCDHCEASEGTWGQIDIAVTW